MLVVLHYHFPSPLHPSLVSHAVEHIDFGRVWTSVLTQIYAMHIISKNFQ